MSVKQQTNLLMGKLFSRRTLGAGLFGIAVLAVATTLSLRPLPPELPPHRDDLRKAQLTDRHGVPLTITYENDWNIHERAPLVEIPLLLQQAFIEAEDRRFPVHRGVDWQARLAAVWQNARAMRAVRGASTISEQVVRMLHPRPRTVWSRWLEGWEAMRLEARFSKADILEFYLNQVPYSGQRRGVAQAARHYFDRDLSTLAPQEMLALAVLVRSPSRFDLYADPARLRPQLHRLAGRMRDIGVIDGNAHQYLLLAEFELKRPSLPVPIRHFAEHLFPRLPESARQQVRIATTLDARLQSQVHAILDQWRQSLAGQGVRNAAALVADHRTGEILAWANAHAPGEGSAYDAATLPRQAGSTLKPLLYALTLERGWTAATLIDDNPLSEAVGQGQHAYQNYSRSHYGPVRLRDALGNSLNIPAVRAAQFVGPGEFLAQLRALGFHSLRQHPDYYGDGLALGNGEITLLELTTAFAALANDGNYRPLRVLRDAPGSAPQPVLSRAASHIIANILADPDARRLEFGAGGIMRFPVETAIKTGTSSDYRDAWVAAFNHRFTVGVWMGNLDGSPMQEITGSRGPVPVARAIFAELNRRTPSAPLPMDPSLVQVVICRDTGLAATDDCPSRPEWFAPEQLPQPSIAATAQPAPLRIQQPSWDLQLALDPRLPADRQYYAFQLSATPSNGRIDWLVNGERAGSGSQYLWRLQRGQHKVQARISTDDGRVQQTAEVPFQVH